MDKKSALKLLMNTFYYDLEDEDTGIRRFSKIINSEEINLSFVDIECFCDWAVRIEYPDNDIRIRPHVKLLEVRNLIREVESMFPNKVTDMFD